MKQEIEISVKFTLDFDDRELVEFLREVMVERGKTADQIRDQIHKEIFDAVKDAVEDEFGNDPMAGVSYVVEDVSK